MGLIGEYRKAKRKEKNAVSKEKLNRSTSKSIIKAIRTAKKVSKSKLRRSVKSGIR